MKKVIEHLIAAGDLAIVPWILRKQMYANGLSKNNRHRTGDELLTREETIELMLREMPRYGNAIIEGTALRRLPNPEVIFVIMNQGKWDEELRGALTQQLCSREAVATMAALLLPPAHGIDRKALVEMFDVDVVATAIAQIDFENPPLEPWIDNAVRQFTAIIGGHNNSFELDFQGDDEDEQAAKGNK